MDMPSDIRLGGGGGKLEDFGPFLSGAPLKKFPTFFRRFSCENKTSQEIFPKIISQYSQNIPEHLTCSSITSFQGPLGKLAPFLDFYLGV
jgi:hypothetical protein